MKPERMNENRGKLLRLRWSKIRRSDSPDYLHGRQPNPIVMKRDNYARGCSSLDADSMLTSHQPQWVKATNAAKTLELIPRQIKKVSALTKIAWQLPRKTGKGRMGRKGVSFYWLLNPSRLRANVPGHFILPVR